ncbi:MAG: Rieske 2Fe-2S domain-containing protein [Halioglobus sp.]
MSAERPLELAIPFGWYCVGFSDELAVGEVKPVRYFGQDLVMYRTLTGEACLASAYCPHLGAHLGHGGVVDEVGINCPFHGWKFTTGGEVAEIPYASALPPRAFKQGTQEPKPCLRTFEIDERNEFIFAWYHPDGAEPSFSVAPFEELDSGEWTKCTRNQWVINTQLQETAENAVDTAHFATVHNTGGIEPRTEVTFDGVRRKSIIYLGHQRVDVEGAIAEKDTETVEGQIHSVNVGPGQTWNRNYGIDLLMIGLPAPIEANKLELRFACSVPKAYAEKNADINQLIIENACEQVNQDIPIWENKIYRADPMLCDGDGPIAQFRKWFKQFYA